MVNYNFLLSNGALNFVSKFFLKKFRRNMAGFTMIELMVSVGIFGLIVGIISGILVLSLQSERRIIALRNVEDNTRFVLESMSREIRTGKNFSGVSGVLSFTNANGQLIAYRLNGGAVEKSVDGGMTYSAVTGAEIKVDYLNFYLSGEAAGDKLQPRITVTVGATSKVSNQSADLKIQTTISERLLQS